MGELAGASGPVAGDVSGNVSGNVLGYVLAGGHSSRMGRDKSQLAWGQGTLLEHVTGVVREALGSATVIRPFGSQLRSGAEIADLVEDRGPLGGLFTALSTARTEWIVMVACDMPNLTPGLLRNLAGQARRTAADAVVCQTQGERDHLHPLCAAYHRRLKPLAETALIRNSLKMHDFLSQIRVDVWPVGEPQLLANINTPEDLAAWNAALPS